VPDQDRGGQAHTPGAERPEPDVTRTDLPTFDKLQRPAAEPEPEAQHADRPAAPAQWYPQQPPAAQWYPQQPAAPQYPQPSPALEAGQAPRPEDARPYAAQSPGAQPYTPPAQEPRGPAQVEAPAYTVQPQSAQPQSAQPQSAQPQGAQPNVPVPAQPPIAGGRRDPGELVGHEAHGDSLLRRVGQGVTRVFQPAQEVQTAAQFGEWVQHPITTGRRIAITSIRGGAGKSTVAALLATVYGHYRQDRVLALDVDPGLGSLALRLGIAPAHSLGDLAENTEQTRSFEEIQPYLTQAGQQLWVLPATRSAVHDSAMDAHTYQTAAAPLSRFFSVTVVDCGAGLLGDLPRAVLSGAHAQILVTHATLDGAVSAREALDWMAAGGFPELVSRTVVVFVARNPDAEAILDLNRVSALVQERGAGVVRLGYDRHVALGTTLDARRMAYATRLTAVRMAAETLRRALTV
jgi:MinD-like ATPase involved in chromosome partitioning or flagellar assembly